MLSSKEVDSLALILFYRTTSKGHHSSSATITASDIDDIIGGELVRREQAATQSAPDIDVAPTAQASNEVLSFDASRYTEFVQAVRNTFSESTSQSPIKHGMSAKELRFHARDLFKKLDENNSGVVSKSELESSIQSLAALLQFELSAEEACLFPEMLAEQIDVDRSGSISVQELEQFLSFQSNEDIRELGVLVHIARESLVRCCDVKYSDDDRAFMEKITDFGRVQPHQGKDLIVSQSLKRVLGRAGRLNPDEASNVLQNIDSNEDGVVSSRELKSWLFPKEASEERKRLLDKFAALINESFEGDASVFVDQLQRRMSAKTEKVGLSDFSSFVKVSNHLFRRFDCSFICYFYFHYLCYNIELARV